MIVVILPNGHVVHLMQLGDFPKPKKTYTFKFQEVPTGGIVNYIRKCFRRKRMLKKGKKTRQHKDPRPNHVIWDYPTRGPAPRQGTITEQPAVHAPQVARVAQGIAPARKLRYRQATLPDLAFGNKTLLNDVHTKFIDRFPPVPSVQCEDFCAQASLQDEWAFYQEVPEYRGRFQHLLLLNSFTHWDNVEAEIRQAGFHPKGFSVKEFVKWDLLRHSTGIQFSTQFRDIAGPWDKSALAGAFDHPGCVPDPHHFSYYYGYFKSEHFRAFFLGLVKECIQHKIIIPRIAGADGVFLRSWAGNFTKDKWGNPTDPEATITVHGRKFYGKGFMTVAFFAWCGSRWLPVYGKTYTGSISENKVYQEVVTEFLAALPYDWKILTYDLGADSADNRRFTRAKGMVCVMPAKEGETYGTVVEIGHGRYFFAEDIPNGMSVGKFGRLYDHRAQVEAGLSPLDLAYNMKEMSRMGLEAASMHMYKYFTLLLLHALTAFKVNRPDLIMSAKAFTSISF